MQTVLPKNILLLLRNRKKPKWFHSVKGRP